MSFFNRVLVFGTLCLTTGHLGLASSASASAAQQLRSRIELSPVLPLRCDRFSATPPSASWHSGTISGVTVGKDGSIYEIQRGDKSPPVLVLDPTGHLLRSWGMGQYTIPHSIRLDPEGNVWTVDAASSTVIKYSPSGQELTKFEVGGQPNNGSPFNGATDIGFGPNGHVFITDGYGNARVLEYTATGELVKKWGMPGSGPGEFNLPHSLQIDKGIIYIADRENGRIESFDLSGQYLGQIAHLGRIYSIKIVGNVIWASTGPPDRPAGSSGGWLLKIDKGSGSILGHLDIAAAGTGHALDLSLTGEPLLTSGDALLWCKAH
jgi:hypothetical protein